MKKHLFISSKPLQLVIQNSVIATYFSRNQCSLNLWLIGSFYNSAGFYEKIALSKGHWSQIKYFKSKYVAYLNLLLTNRYDNLYIDSDYGSINLILMFCKLFGKNIYVVEEGIGIYSKNLLKSYDHIYGKYYFIKRIWLTVIGSGLYFGGSIWTDGIFVFNPIKYKQVHNKHKKTVHHIKVSLKHQIINNIGYYAELFELNPLYELAKKTSYNNIVIYSAPYMINNFYKKYIGVNTLFILKLHPGFSDYKSLIFDNRRVVLLKNCAPTELVVYLLLTLNKSITVLHENSSVGEYLDGEINTINLR